MCVCVCVCVCVSERERERERESRNEIVNTKGRARREQIEYVKEIVRNPTHTFQQSSCILKKVADDLSVSGDDFQFLLAEN